MKDVNEAYAVLSDPAKRQNYDTYRQQYGDSAYHQFRGQYSEQDIYKGSDIHNIFEEMSRSFGFRGFDDIFKDFYGSNYRGFQFQKPGLNIKGFFFAGSWDGKTSSAKSASSQGFLGKVSQFLLKQITGTQLPQRGANIQDVIELQPHQAMKGGPYAYYHRKKSKKLIVHIPPQVKNGQRIRLSGMGENGKGGAEAGDLLIKVQVKKNIVEKLKSHLTLFKK
jgi:DnaJ-class molecular chaperone